MKRSAALSQAFEDDLRRHAGVVDRETECDLARRAQAGDVRARNKLISANLKLVIKIAFEFRRHNIDHQDTVQEGSLGLFEAVKRFDPDRGFKFCTYAQWWIRAYILNFVGSQGPAVQLKHSTRTQRIVIFGGGAADPDDTIKQLGNAQYKNKQEAHEREIRAIANAMHPAIPLDKPLDTRDADGSRCETIGDKFYDPEQPSAEDLVVDASVTERLRAVVERVRLSEREREILERRTLANKPCTFMALGSEWGITRQRVEQIEKRLISKLQDEFHRV